MEYVKGVKINDVVGIRAMGIDPDRMAGPSHALRHARVSLTKCLCVMLSELNTCYRALTRNKTLQSRRALQCCVDRCLCVILGDLTTGYYKYAPVHNVVCILQPGAAGGGGVPAAGAALRVLPRGPAPGQRGGGQAGSGGAGAPGGVRLRDDGAAPGGDPRGRAWRMLLATSLDAVQIKSIHEG